MNLEELLGHISGQLEELSDKDELTPEDEKKMKDLEAQKAQLEEQKKTVSAEPETEVERLRRELRERQRSDTARSISQEIVRSVRDEQETEARELTELVRKEVASLMGGNDVESVVRDVMRNTRSGSRFIGQGAVGRDLVETVAEGGSYGVQKSEPMPTGYGDKGAIAECKDIWASKSLGRFFSIVARAQKSEIFLSDGEKRFVKELLQRKALAEGTDSSGGFLVPQEWMPDILGLLRAATTVRRSGPRIVPFNKQMNQTSISSGATASYTGENARIAPSEQTFAEAPLLTPKNLTGLVPVSNYLLADAPAAEELVRQDLAEVLALREDLAFLRGTGSGGEPIGLRNITGKTVDPITVPTNGFQPTISQLRTIRATFRALNAGAVRLAWFFHPSFLSYLETRTDTTGRFLLDTNLLTISEDGTSGTLDGIPFYTTTQVPINLTVGSSSNATDITLCNMAETIVGINQELELAVSSEASWSTDGTNWNSAFQQNQTLFRAVIRHDIAHRRPNQIVVQTGVLV